PLLVELSLNTPDVCLALVVLSLVALRSIVIANNLRSGASNGADHPINGTLGVILHLTGSLLALAFLVLGATRTDELGRSNEVAGGLLNGTYSLVVLSSAAVVVVDGSTSGREIDGAWMAYCQPDNPLEIAMESLGVKTYQSLLQPWRDLSRLQHEHVCPRPAACRRYCR